MKVAISPTVVDNVTRDALRRIRAAARRGWSCRLPSGSVMVIAAGVDAWRERGLDAGAERRILRADAGRRGVRLTVEECRGIVAAVDAEAPAP